LAVEGQGEGPVGGAETQAAALERTDTEGQGDTLESGTKEVEAQPKDGEEAERSVDDGCAAVALVLLFAEEVGTQPGTDPLVGDRDDEGSRLDDSSFGGFDSERTETQGPEVSEKVEDPSEEGEATQPFCFSEDRLSLKNLSIAEGQALLGGGLGSFGSEGDGCFEFRGNQKVLLQQRIACAGKEKDSHGDSAVLENVAAIFGVADEEKEGIIFLHLLSNIISKF
jgi:hypothetical protein